jgi:hypothetical protein
MSLLLRKPEMTIHTIDVETPAAARSLIAMQSKNGFQARLAGGGSEMVAVERWENEGGRVSDGMERFAASRLRKRIESRCFR